MCRVAAIHTGPCSRRRRSGASGSCSARATRAVGGDGRRSRGVPVTSRWKRARKSTSREPEQGGDAGGPSGSSRSVSPDGPRAGPRAGRRHLQYPRAGPRWHGHRASYRYCPRGGSAGRPGHWRRCRSGHAADRRGIVAADAALTASWGTPARRRPRLGAVARARPGAAELNVRVRRTDASSALRPCSREWKPCTTRVVSRAVSYPPSSAC